VAISRLGAAEVWPTSGTGAPVVLKHPARVGALAFTSDGSKLLTTSSDGKARIFSAGGGQPIEHAALENGCERMPLAALSPDGNTLVTAIAVICGLSLLLLREVMRKQQAGKIVAHATVFVVLFLGIVTVFGPYVDHYEKYGSPFVTNFQPDPKPLWFEKTHINHPGVRSIADAYFTFRFVDMLQHPHNTRWSWSYPEHRTSLWSQIYGQTVSLHFASSPPSWHTDWKPLLWVDRALMVLALPFVLCFAVGFALRFRDSVCGLIESMKK
jgi:WD40 repeat protein